VVEIETRCRIPIWRTFGKIQWHVIPEPHAIAGCKISVRHIENRFRHILFFVFVFNAVQALTSGGFRIISDTLVTFYGRLMLRPRLTEVRETFTRGGP